MVCVGGVGVVVLDDVLVVWCRGDWFGCRCCCVCRCLGVAVVCFFLVGEAGIRDLLRFRGLGEVCKRQLLLLLLLWLCLGCGSVAVAAVSFTPLTLPTSFRVVGFAVVGLLVLSFVLTAYCLLLIWCS